MKMKSNEKAGLDNNASINCLSDVFEENVVAKLNFQKEDKIPDKLLENTEQMNFEDGF